MEQRVTVLAFGSTYDVSYTRDVSCPPSIVFIHLGVDCWHVMRRSVRSCDMAR